MSLAIRYNNPGCIKNDPSDPWKGSLGSDARGHAIFRLLRWCIRAMLITLLAKERNGKTTIRRLMHDWAPEDDTIGSIEGGAPNRPDRYAEFVARRVGLGPDEPFDLFVNDTGAVRPEAVPVLVGIYRAIERMESGGDLNAPVSELLYGAYLYYLDRVEKREVA